MQALMDQVTSTIRWSSDPTQRMLVGCHLITYQAWLGDLDHAAKVLALLNKSASLETMPPLASIWLGSAESMYAVFTGDADRCLKTVEREWRRAMDYGLDGWSSVLLANGTYGALMNDDLKTAQSYLNKLRRLPDHLGLCDHIQGWIAFLEGDLFVARQSAERALANVAEQMGGSSCPEGINHFTLALVSHAEGHTRQAERYLANAEAVADTMQSQVLKYMVLLARADLAFAVGHEGEGLASLRDAMGIGRSRGLVNFPWWSPSMMARLCAKALEAGIEVEYVQHLVQKRHLVPDHPPLEITSWLWTVEIHTLGRFEVIVNGHPIRFSRKGQKRPLELLKALIAFGGLEVAETTLTDALWPDAEGDAAHEVFRVTLHRLRKLIGTDALELKNGRLSLRSQLCYVDVWAFERLLEHAAQTANLPDSHRMREKAVALYTGPFLEDEEVGWAQRLRDRLRKDFTGAVLSVGKQLAASGRPDESVSWLGKCLRLDPQAGEFPALLVKCQMK
jgi:LuxR family transcriptional regulator, maltose regulon positive regulatory protein